MTSVYLIDANSNNERNSQVVLVSNYSDELFLQYRFRCPTAFDAIILTICEQIYSFHASSYVMFCVG